MFYILYTGSSLRFWNTTAHDSQYPRVPFDYRDEQPFAPHSKSHNSGTLSSFPTPGFIPPVPDFLPRSAQSRQKPKPGFISLPNHSLRFPSFRHLPLARPLKEFYRLLSSAPAHSPYRLNRFLVPFVSSRRTVAVFAVYGERA